MKSKITFIITDTHFGVRQNSMTWINSQLDFLYNQLIPHIQQCKDSNLYECVELIHMGDVFDSRSTISTLIASKVVKVFKELNNLCNVHIIAGNHDFYSPNSDEVDTLSLILKQTNVNLYTNKPYINDNNLYIPWYQWGSVETQELIINQPIKNIFTHADIVTQQIPYIQLGDINIFSGHIHTPSINKNKRLYNLGSCYSLNFADANCEHGYYTIIDNESPTFYPNTKSIKFWRLYNEDIFDSKKYKNINSKDYVELYISQTNMIDQNYVEKINEYTNNLKNIWIIPQVEMDGGESLEKFEGYDIEKITKKMIPAELMDKFNMVLNYNN